jgi:hypothetical protein
MTASVVARTNVVIGPGQEFSPSWLFEILGSYSSFSLEHLSNDGTLSLDGVRQAPFQVFTGITATQLFSDWTFVTGAVGSSDQLLLSATDSNGNTSSATVSITVSSSALPDLTTSLLGTSDYTTGNPSTTFSAGSFIGVNFDESNLGVAATALPHTVGVYLSLDSTITTADTLIGTYNSPPPSWLFYSGFSVNNGIYATLPSNLPTGTYYVGLVDDINNQVTESNEANNASSAIQIHVTGAVAAPPQGAVTGSAGNDSFVALGTDLTFNGGGGHDTLIFAGIASDYDFTIGGNAQLTVTDGDVNRDGMHQLNGIEFLQFADKVVFVEDADNANIARLYSAALNRAPDIGGQGAWEDAYSSMIPASVKAQGVYASLAQTPFGGLPSLADGFILSPEFQQKYGALNDTQYVTQLYQNVLNRAPDAAGLAGWLDAMSHGSTRAVVLVGFAESAENVAKTAADWLIQV